MKYKKVEDKDPKYKDIDILILKNVNPNDLNTSYTIAKVDRSGPEDEYGSYEGEGGKVIQQLDLNDYLWVKLLDNIEIAKKNWKEREKGKEELK